MLLSLEKRFLFVANTKTASTSIEVALTPYADIVRDGTPARKHTGLHELYDIYRYVFKEPGQGRDAFFTFGVMRDPVDWIGSWYRYRKGNQVQAPLPPEMGFAGFWALKDWNIMRPKGGGKNLQRDMFCAPDGSVLADVIIPYHKLGPVFGDICDALDIARPLERHNVSQITTPQVHDPALLDEMRDFYKEDYALFDRLDDLNAAGLERLRNRGAA